MPFESRRLGVQLQCVEQSNFVVRRPQQTLWETILVKEPAQGPWTIKPCPNHSCFWITPPCFLDSEPPDDICPGGSIPGELDPEDPDVVLLRPEHLPRLRGHLQMKLAQIDEIAQRKGEIESRLEELDAAEKELKKRTG
ncbi:MAG TPA: hypothetical protein VFX35_00160 [Solirubrobacterales bacterium]|nr:hypothetical protein [Solirubrobacterales bacterium]